MINKKSTAEIINSYLYEYNDANSDLKSRETITNDESIKALETGTTTFTPNILKQRASVNGHIKVYQFR